MFMARKNKQATDKKTMEKWVKQNGIRISMYLDKHDFTYTLPGTALCILGVTGEDGCGNMNQNKKHWGMA